MSGRVTSIQNIFLSVVIPTFNRVEKVQNRLNELLPNKDDSVEIVVVDNNSPDLDSKICEEWSRQGVRIIRNENNIGAPANVVKAFECAHGKYIWMISDDDPVVEGSMQIIMTNIDDNPGCCLFSYGHSEISASIVGKGVSEYVRLMPSLSVQILLGNIVYKKKYLIDRYNILYHYSSSMCPQFIAGLICISDSGSDFIFYNNQLVTTEKITSGVQWPYLSAYQMFDVLTSSPLLTFIDARVLRAKIWKSLPPMHVFYASLLYLSVYELSVSRCLNIYSYIFRHAPFSRKLVLLGFLPIVLLPAKLRLFVLRVAEKIFKRKINVSSPY